MVESIKNMMNSVDVLRSRQGSVSNAPTGSGSAVKSTGHTGSVESKLETPSVIAQLAEAPPVDTESVTRIKKAIAAGKYPVDVDRISDALMDAYRDLKS
jgi:negative regulator of flagellin synthesis FlgM